MNGDFFCAQNYGKIVDVLVSGGHSVDKAEEIALNAVHGDLFSQTWVRGIHAEIKDQGWDIFT